MGLAVFFCLLVCSVDIQDRYDCYITFPPNFLFFVQVHLWKLSTGRLGILETLGLSQNLWKLLIYSFFITLYLYRHYWNTQRCFFCQPNMLASSCSNPHYLDICVNLLYKIIKTNVFLGHIIHAYRDFKLNFKKITLLNKNVAI